MARGEYKSAANMFTKDRYTDAHREADTGLVESLRAQVWQGIAESRKLEPADLDALADRAPLLRDDAVSAGLVDRIGFRDEGLPQDRRTGRLRGDEGLRRGPGLRRRPAAAVPVPLCPDPLQRPVAARPEGGIRPSPW